MPRHISFALTTPQFLDGTKTVTRRIGWETLKAGDTLRAVKKAMGLKKGEKMEVIGYVRVVDVRREDLRRMIDEPAYGADEVRREGFPAMTPADFVEFFCNTHTGCFPEREITRIEFERVESL